LLDISLDAVAAPEAAAAAADAHLADIAGSDDELEELLRLPDAEGPAVAQLQEAKAAVVASLAAFPAPRSPLSQQQLARIVVALLQSLWHAARCPAPAAEAAGAGVQSAVDGLSSLAGDYWRTSCTLLTSPETCV